MALPRLHASLTPRRLIRLISADDMLGACIACGREADHVEPDARQYPCGACGERQVYGAEELICMVPLPSPIRSKVS